jgi:tetratricopeptide (TPR) repeat protein
MCYYIKGLCAATVRNYTDSFQFFNRTREILDANPKIKEDSAQRYVMTTFHLLRCYIENRDFTEAQNLLTEIRGLSGKKGFNTTDISVRIFSSSSNLELYMLQLKGDFHLAIQLLENIDIQRTEFADKISKEQEVMFLYNKAYCYFGIGEFKRALSFLNEVLNDNEQNLRQDIYSFSRILNLILHYELENYEFLEYVIKSTNRYLSKYERDYRIEDVFIKFLRKLSKSTDQIQTQEIMEAMFDEVQILMQNHDERVILEYFNMPAWLFGKINKLPFNEAVIAYNQKFIA